MFFDQDPIYKRRDPPILKYFYVPKQVKEWLIDECYNNENIRLRRMWRRALDRSAEKHIDDMRDEAFTHDGTMYVVIDGDPGTGKSTLATTLLIEYYERQAKRHDGQVICDRVRTYSQLNAAMAWAEGNKKVLIVHKDENDRELGADEKIQKMSAMSTIEGGRKKHLVIISCGLRPDSLMKDAMSTRATALGYDELQRVRCQGCSHEQLRQLSKEEYIPDEPIPACPFCGGQRYAETVWAVNLALIWSYKGRRPKGLICKLKRLDHLPVYKEQYAWSMETQGDLALSGGAVSAEDRELYNRKIQKITEKAIEMFPNENRLRRGHYLSVGQFERAIIESGEMIQTGKPRAAVQDAVMEFFDKYVKKRGPSEEEKQGTKAIVGKVNHRRDNHPADGVQYEDEWSRTVGPRFYDQGKFEWVSKDKKDYLGTDFLGLFGGRPCAVDAKGLGKPLTVFRWKELQGTAIEVQKQIAAGHPDAIGLLFLKAKYEDRIWVKKVDPTNHHQQINIHKGEGIELERFLSMSMDEKLHFIGLTPMK